MCLLIPSTFRAAAGNLHDQPATNMKHPGCRYCRLDQDKLVIIIVSSCPLQRLSLSPLPQLLLHAVQSGAREAVKVIKSDHAAGDNMSWAHNRSYRRALQRLSTPELSS